MTASTNVQHLVPARRRQLTHALVLVIPMLLTFILGFGVIGPAVGLNPDDPFDGSAPALLTTLLMGAYAVFGVVGFGLMRLGHVSLSQLGWTSEGPRRHLGAAALGTLALIGVMLATMLAFGLEFTSTWEAIASFTPQQRVQMLLIGFIAGAGEESLFRGYLQPALAERFGATAGVLLGALIFAVYHFPVTPRVVSLVAKFGFGLVLGVLRHRTGSVWAPALAHLMFWQVMGFA